VKIPQRKVPRGFVRGIVLGALAAVALLATLVVMQSRPERAVRKKQESLVDGIERRSPARMRRLISEEYGDRWGFTRDDAVEAMLDAGSQFLVLVVDSEERGFERKDSRVEVSAILTLSGRPAGPAAGEVTRRINRLDAPFVFTWKKESFLPQSWRLVRIDNEDLPRELYGYRPGDIRRMMRGE